MLKTVSSVTNALGALVYQGTWNASTNNPALASGVGVKGYYYVVSVAGTTNLDGIALWSIGDWAVFNGATWQKVDGGTSEAYVNLTVSGTANIATGNVTNLVSSNVQITAGNIAANIAGSYGLPSGNVTGLGTMATQNSNSVTITGGNISANLVSSNVTLTGGTINVTNVAVSNGVMSTNQFNGAYSDGTVVDYTPTNGRISVGINDTLTFYAGGPGNVATGNVTSSGTWNLPNVAVTGTVTGPAPVTVTADYTVANSAAYIINNKSGSTMTVTLPAASSFTGRSITIQNYQAQTVISASSNVVPQGGGSASTAILANVAGNWARLISDGTNWVIMEAATFNNLLLE